MKSPPICPITHTSKLLTLSLALFLGVTLYSIVGTWLEISLMQDVANKAPVSLDQLLDFTERHRTTYLVKMGTWFISCIVFIFFTVRAVQSAIGTGAEGMRSTPGMAAGSFFIPLYNFVGPYLAMQESWRALDYDADEDSWHSSKSSLLIGLWWFSWIASRLFAMLIPGKGIIAEENIDRLWMQFASNCIDLGLTLLALLMVRAVTIRAVAKWEKIHGARGVPAAKARNV